IRAPCSLAVVGEAEVRLISATRPRELERVSVGRGAAVRASEGRKLVGSVRLCDGFRPDEKHRERELSHSITSTLLQAGLPARAKAHTLERPRDLAWNRPGATEARTREL